MIRRTSALDRLEADFARNSRAGRSYVDALAVFAAMWDHARQMRPDFPTDWREDIQADIELARVLNGLEQPG